MPANAAFCKNCGAQAMVVAGRNVEVKKQKGGKAKIILYLVALALLLAGLRVPLTMLAGKRTTAVIESVQQDITSSNKLDYDYDIKYVFVSDRGQHVSGSYRLARVYNVSKLPQEGSMLEVKYLPGLTFINLPTNIQGIGRSAFILIGLGLVILFFAIKTRAT